MPLVGARPIYRPPLPGEPLHLRDDGHWSTQGLVGYWPMREMWGHMTQDLSPFGNHGRLVGGLEWASGDEGSAVRNPTDTMRYINCGDIQGVTTVWTFIARVYWDADNFLDWGGKRIDTYNRTLVASYGSKLSITLTRPPTNTSDVARQAMPISAWTNIAAVVSGRVATTYVNGTPKTDTVSFDPVGMDIIADFCIGAHPSRGGSWAPHSIQRACLYSRVLAATEIAALHADPNLPLWQPRRGISLALVGEEGGAVLPMFGGYNLGKSLLRGANL